jgi:hypothetical protein
MEVYRVVTVVFALGSIWRLKMALLETTSCLKVDPKTRQNNSQGASRRTEGVDQIINVPWRAEVSFRRSDETEKIERKIT